MKNNNKFLILGALILATNYLGAQITLTQSSYPANLVGTDTVVNTVVGSTFPNLTSQTNATWDMTSITDTTSASVHYRVTTSPYEYADSNYYQVLFITYQGDEQQSVTTDGLLDYGVTIPLQRFNLHTFNSALSTSDSLIIFKQFDAKSVPDTVIKFPGTYNTDWTNKYVQSNTSLMTITEVGYILDTLVQKLYVAEYDTIKGWGNMRVKNLSSDTSLYNNVLQLQVTINVIDSFFVNGDTVPNAYLNVIGYYQGQIVNTYNQYYYRPEKVYPFAQVEYANSSFNSPKLAYTNLSNFQNTDGIAVISENVDNTTVYPNPSNGQFYFEIRNGEPGAKNIEVYNVLGEKVYNSPLSTLSSPFSIDLSSQPAGIYLYHVITEDGNLIGNGKFVIEK